MNKLLHVLVYVFLVLAGAALFFELQLNAKRAELTDRNRLQEDYFVKIAATIEKAEPDKAAAFEIKKDASPVEAKLVDSPDMENVLEEYKAALEQANLKTYNLDGSRTQLRSVYVLDGEGKPLMDGNQPQTRGSEEDKVLNQLFESAKTQQSRLNSTRAALAALRGKLDEVVGELNTLKPQARKDKVIIDEQGEKITKLEGEKTALEGQNTKIRSQISELNAEIASKNDEIEKRNGEIEAAKEEIDKKNVEIKNLQAKIRAMVIYKPVDVSTEVTSGEKGTVTEADNENMFVIVKFPEETMKEFRGEKQDKPLPLIELNVKRPGFKGPAGEFIGRVRIRQAIKGKPYVICDILGSWAQDSIKPNDILFAD